MKKTTKPETQTAATPKLAVRKERIRDLKTPDLENVVGGFNVHSVHSSCC